MAPDSSFGTAPVLMQQSIVRTLPPLILHPFADAGGPSKLVESSRANLKLQGLLPQGEASREDLDKALLDGRYSELRMLFPAASASRALPECSSRTRPAACKPSSASGALPTTNRSLAALSASTFCLPTHLRETCSPTNSCGPISAPPIKSF